VTGHATYLKDRLAQARRDADREFYMISMEDPGCDCDHDTRPYRWRFTDAGRWIEADYRCPVCDERWTTGWDRAFIESGELFVRPPARDLIDLVSRF
jgi:hypothetical protein